MPCVALLCGGVPRTGPEKAGTAATYQDPLDLPSTIGSSPPRARGTAALIGLAIL